MELVVKHAKFAGAILDVLFQAKLERGLPLQHNQCIKDYNGTRVFFFANDKVVLIDPEIRTRSSRHRFGSYAKQSTGTPIKFIKDYLNTHDGNDKVKVVRFNPLHVY